MKKAVYIVIVLWFLRKVLGKVCSQGVRETFRVHARRIPGSPGYDRMLDEQDDCEAWLHPEDGSGWLVRVPGGRRDDLSSRQLSELCDEARRRYCGEGDCSVSFAKGGMFRERGGAPGWAYARASMIGDFIRGVKG